MAEGGGESKGLDEDHKRYYGTILEPLLFPDSPDSSTQLINFDNLGDSSGGESTLCLMCEHRFKMVQEKDGFLKHLVTVHKMVLADVNLVCNLSKYVEYWRKRFQQEPIKNFCSVIHTNSRPTDKGPKEEYYLLSDVLPEDKQIREYLQRKRLDWILETQQKERMDSSFSRGCLFCRQHFEGNRAELLNHMAHDHGFSVGQPDNLVFTTEFLDSLEDKFKNLQCVYCEKTFKDRMTLKDHMRKKQHKRINPKNTSYDKFYVINYLELGKNWESVQAEPEYDVATPESLSDVEDQEDWSDWEENTGAAAYCLFCDFNASTIDTLESHMKETHCFDLIKVKDTLDLNFYQQVKLINYIRRQVYQDTCLFCLDKFTDRDSTMEHMRNEKHMEVPSKDIWDQPQYYFPTYENDTLLCLLTDDDDDDTSGETKMSNIVVPEDTPHVDSILQDSNVRQHLS
ncbi:zinc finger protein 277-like [Glandiceps talaboti]